MRTSSTGSGTHSIRSINVRANMLSEWTTNQGRYRIEMARCLIAIVLCATVALVIIPLCERARGAIVAVQRVDEATLRRLQSAISAAQATKKSTEPKIASVEVHDQTVVCCRRMIGELFQVLDSANSGMAFASAKIDVREAEAIIDCHADAENYEAAAAFADKAGSSTNTTSTLASTRPNNILGASGISFEYIKRVALQ